MTDEKQTGQKGGLARAQSLSPQERRQIASDAARARWSNPQSKLPRATHAGPLVIGEASIPCAVLSDGRRMLTQDGFFAAIGRAGKPNTGHGVAVSDTPAFLAANNLKEFVSEELRRSSTPILFESKSGGMKGNVAYGYPAELLSDVCWVYINAKLAGKLTHNQEHIAERCQSLVRAFGKVGIIALVDEATGYQADRDRHELQRILEQYIVEEMRRWVKAFPAEFFKQLYRLHNWTYKPGDTKTPRYVGKFIDNYIYKPLPPGVREELRNRNPVVNGRRKHKHHMFLTDDTGVPHLTEQIRTVTVLMKGADNKGAFERAFKRVFPPPSGHQLTLGLDAKSEEDEEGSSS